MHQCLQILAYSFSSEQLKAAVPSSRQTGSARNNTAGSGLSPTLGKILWHSLSARVSSVDWAPGAQHTFFGCCPFFSLPHSPPGAFCTFQINCSRPSNSAGVNYVGPLTCGLFSLTCKFKSTLLTGQLALGICVCGGSTKVTCGFSTAQEASIPNPHVFKAQLYLHPIPWLRCALIEPKPREHFSQTYLCL